MGSIYSLFAFASFLAAAVATAINSAPSITSIDTATCTPQSIAACPTAYDPCCAFICAEAQVPFLVCAPSNRTVLASCSQCPAPTATAALKNTTSLATVAPWTNSTVLSTITSAKNTASLGTITPTTTLTSSLTITTPPSSSTLSTSTCTARLLSTAGCPTPYDPCCAYVCAEAQVPFDVCQPTDVSGQFAVCSKCAGPTSRP